MDISQRSNHSAHDGSSSPRKKQIMGAPAAPSSAAQAASSLALLLREDRLMTEYELHVSGKTEEVAFTYAAALLQNEASSGLGGGATAEVTQRATDALAEVHRKLALVESLAERVSRTSPEAVAGPLLRLHGYMAKDDSSGIGANNSSGTTISRAGVTTLATVRERGERLKRQGEVLEGVARRVETSLQRGMKRMETVTSRLSRVLSLSATLKMILRLKFESSKLQGYELDDPRDLTRAAASVSVVEDLLARPELKDVASIEAIEEIRPGIERTAGNVRRAAASLLEKHHKSATGSSSSSVVQLGTTLQVYYHLGELPQAAWNAVDHALAAADQVSAEFFSVETIGRITETATAEAKRAAGGKGGDANAQRMLKKKLRELRAAGAAKWGAGITEAALQVWNLHRVLCRKTDPVGRIVYVDVVAAADVPAKYQRKDGQGKLDFNIFSLFWERLCVTVADRVEETLGCDNGRFSADAAALYPAVRSASLDMMGFLQDTMQAGAGTAALDDGASGSAGGILGGSSVLDDAFIGWSTSVSEANEAQATLGVTSADTWTRAENTEAATSSENFMSSATNLSLSAIFQSAEWKVLEGSASPKKGLLPLQGAFQQASMGRLCTPLQYMFPENITIEETGLAASTLPLLPSKYDVQKFDQIIRQELSLADPREGGGDLSAVKMIAGSIVRMVREFCAQAQNALCNPSIDACLSAEGLSSNLMTHDIKVTKILYTLTTYMRQTPEKTFIAPYRPAITQQHEEAASICQAALVPAINEIEKMASSVLSPLIRALNRRVAATIARVHLGVYKDDGKGAELDAEGPSFVQQHLAPIFDEITKNQLTKLPPEYAALVASSVTAFSIYTFVSSIALIRPLGESARLHITQDLADFEMILEQFVAKTNWSVSLSQIENGKPYAELRSVRQMLFWSGLDNKEKPAAVIAKSMVRETWIKDVRPSTVCHFLFSFAPSLLSSPHHSKRMRAEDYVANLVQLDADIEDGEANAWMTIMACCDSYHQRESVDRGNTDGDARVSRILMDLGGPELLRPRRH